MPWETITVSIEVIGVVAVVATLFYLSTEIRQNRIAVETASQASISDGFNSINMAVAADESLTALFARGMEDPDSLTDLERSRLVMIGQSYINQFTVVKRLKDNDAISAGQYDALAIGFSHLMASPGGRYISKLVAVSPDLIAVVESYQSRPRPENYFEIRNPNVSSNV